MSLIRSRFPTVWSWCWGVEGVGARQVYFALAVCTMLQVYNTTSLSWFGLHECCFKSTNTTSLSWFGLQECCFKSTNTTSLSWFGLHECCLIWFTSLQVNNTTSLSWFGLHECCFKSTNTTSLSWFGLQVNNTTSLSWFGLHECCFKSTNTTSLSWFGLHECCFKSTIRHPCLDLVYTSVALSQQYDILVLIGLHQCREQSGTQIRLRNITQRGAREEFRDIAEVWHPC